MIKTYTFSVELTDGRQRIRRVTSKHLNGAVRKLYQTYDVERVIAIL